MAWEITRYVNGRKVDEEAFFSGRYRSARADALLRRVMREKNEKPLREAAQSPRAET